MFDWLEFHKYVLDDAYKISDISEQGLMIDTEILIVLFGLGTGFKRFLNGENVLSRKKSSNSMRHLNRRFYLMPAPYTGGCQCGNVRYTLKGEPLRLYACHCTACQQQSGSAFGMSMIMDKKSVEIKGELKSFVRTADSGG